MTRLPGDELHFDFLFFPFHENLTRESGFYKLAFAASGFDGRLLEKADTEGKVVRFDNRIEAVSSFCFHAPAGDVLTPMAEDDPRGCPLRERQTVLPPAWREE